MRRSDYDAITDAMSRAKPRPHLANPDNFRAEHTKLIAWLDCRDMLADALAGSDPKFKKEQFKDDCQ